MYCKTFCLKSKTRLRPSPLKTETRPRQDRDIELLRPRCKKKHCKIVSRLRRSRPRLHLCQICTLRFRLSAKCWHMLTSIVTGRVSGSSTKNWKFSSQRGFIVLYCTELFCVSWPTVIRANRLFNEFDFPPGCRQSPNNGVKHRYQHISYKCIKSKQ